MKFLFFALFLSSYIVCNDAISGYLVDGILENKPEGTTCGNPVFNLEAKPTLRKRVLNSNYPVAELPWLAVLFERTDAPNVGLNSTFGRYVFLPCTAVLIHPEFLLTAAQCVAEHWRADEQKNCSSNYQLIARMGSKDIAKRGANFTDFPIDHFFFHKEYNESNPEGGYDIALLHLALEKGTDPSYTTTDVTKRTLCIPNNTMTNFDPATAVNRTCVISGWGSTGWHEVTYAARFGKTYLQDQCDLKDRNFMADPAMRFCTRPDQNSADSSPCYGDSGAPIFCADNKDGIYRMYGLHSYRNYSGGPLRDTSECYNSAKFAVHSSVVYYEKCIREFLGTWSTQISEYKCKMQMARHVQFCTKKPWNYFQCAINVPDYSCSKYPDTQYTVPQSELFEPMPDFGFFKARSAFLC